MAIILSDQENKIKSGNVIIGLASFGKSTYEEAYNGGMGSNGLTSARHDVFSNEYRKKYPETFDNDLAVNLIYTGSKKLTDPVDGVELNAGKLVLSPTRTYAPIIDKIFQNIDRCKGKMCVASDEDIFFVYIFDFI